LKRPGESIHWERRRVSGGGEGWQKDRGRAPTYHKPRKGGPHKNAFTRTIDRPEKKNPGLDNDGRGGENEAMQVTKGSQTKRGKAKMWAKTVV